MKYLLSLCIGLTLSQTALASGCMPDDVQLATETALTEIGTFDAYQSCHNSICGLSVFNREKMESHYLKPQATVAPRQDQYFGKTEVKIYRQHWAGSCGDEIRYILGAEVEGVRYREENDLTEL